jgi:hypothetical protein
MTTLEIYKAFHEYRHEMRDLKPSVKMEVYNVFLEFDLNPSDVSDLHYQLICEVVGDYTIQGEDVNNRKVRLHKSYK